MTMRTREETVVFRRPFVIAGLEEELPAGAYRVETDEELLEGLSFEAYRRVSSLIRLPPVAGGAGRERSALVVPQELDAALARDRAPEDRAGPRRKEGDQ